jgi:hypothetical protein
MILNLRFAIADFPPEADAPLAQRIEDQNHSTQNNMFNRKSELVNFSRRLMCLWHRK